MSFAAVVLFGAVVSFGVEVTVEMVMEQQEAGMILEKLALTWVLELLVQMSGLNCWW